VRILEIVWTPEILEKIERKHGLTPEEVEEACAEPAAHIRRARNGRYAILGRSESGRYVFVIGAYQGGGIVRIITARDMTTPERDLYTRHN
jgi:uncharacterized DUF497 family protein